MTVPERPAISAQEAVRVADEAFGVGVGVEASELPSYEGRNFRLDDSGGRPLYVLKIAAPGTARSAVELEAAAMRRVAGRLGRSSCPTPSTTRDGDDVYELATASAHRLYCRMSNWVHGRSARNLRPFSPRLCEGFGRFIGELKRALEGLETPGHLAEHQSTGLDVRSVLDHGDLARLLAKTSDERQLIEKSLAQLRAFLPSMDGRLRRSVIHNDVNDDNLMVLADQNDQSPEQAFAIIDFGDVTSSYTIADLAIALAYLLQNDDDPLSAADSIIAGYHRTSGGLEPVEVDALLHLIRARLVLSLLQSTRRSAAEPDNEYLEISRRPGLALLERLAEVSPTETARRWRHLCGLSTASALTREPTALLEERKQRLGPSLSISYEQPLTIVRGERQFLFDHHGNAYLDLVNNVCHVGHCHPRVVAAAHRQSGTLNTNTRYLHENLVDYAARLVALLPEPLEVCFFVCSGSEANELALRLARAHTHRSELVVIDAAYHGNTSSLIEISPYKACGPGGQGVADHVLIVDLPDSYRGRHRGELGETGPAYGHDVEALLVEADNRGRSFAAFIGESMLGCGGQIELPVGYLRSVYRSMRKRGAVCIADEVQVGFGRVGSHFWAFETQDVVPDIVTLGKPIGNGHPMAAVATTREIANSFANGMEYFNTFGGNPVSCAIGLSVLDVIEDQGLRDHADRVGRRLKNALRSLQRCYSEIGDVRGRGLFLGIELVHDGEAREPNADLAAMLAERMREHRILISTDGPDHNVLKIKPPLVLDEDDADSVVFHLECSLDACRSRARLPEQNR